MWFNLLTIRVLASMPRLWVVCSFIFSLWQHVVIPVASLVFHNRNWAFSASKRILSRGSQGYKYPFLFSPAAAGSFWASFAGSPGCWLVSVELCYLQTAPCTWWWLSCSRLQPRLLLLCLLRILETTKATSLLMSSKKFLIAPTPQSLLF